MRKLLNLNLGILFTVLGFLLTSHSQAQGNLVTPRIKTTRTAVYKAVRQDTAWTTGAIVAHIYFVKFDKQGRKWVENSLNPDGSANKKIIYTYGPDGNVREEIIASVTKGGVTDIFQYSYDKWGKIDTLVQMDAERNIDNRVVVTRDEQGKILKQVVEHKKESVVHNFNYVYEEEIWIMEVSEREGVVYTPASLKRKMVKSDSILLRYSERFRLEPAVPKKQKVDFEYDAYGNWVKRTEYYGVNPEHIITRTIDYEGQENDWSELGLNGKVRSVYQTSYVAIPKGPGSIDKGARKGVFFRYEFDRDGRKTREEHFSETGVTQGSTSYTYNEKGLIGKEVRKSAGGNVEAIIEWGYDGEGRLKNKTWCDARGSVQKKGVFIYDMEGNCISELWFGNGGVKMSEFRYRYNPYGQQIEKQVIACEPELASEHKPERMLWNSRGRLAEKWIGSSDAPDYYTYKYNTRGEVIGGTETKAGEAEVKYVYKFFNDERDNWKKKVKFIGDVPVVYEEREYAYYD